MKNQIVYEFGVTSGTSLFIFDVDKQRSHAVSKEPGHVWQRKPTFSDDGKRLLFCESRENGGTNFVSLDLASERKVTLLELESDDYSPALSEDGSKIFFLRKEKKMRSPQLWVYEVSNQCSKLFCDLPDFLIADFALSPHGNEVAVYGLAHDGHPISTGLLTINATDPSKKRFIQPLFVDLPASQRPIRCPELFCVGYVGSDQRVAFSALYGAHGSEDGYDVFVLNMKNGHAARLTKMHTYIERFAVFPDLQKIAYETHANSGNNTSNILVLHSLISERGTVVAPPDGPLLTGCCAESGTYGGKDRTDQSSCRGDGALKPCLSVSLARSAQRGGASQTVGGTRPPRVPKIPIPQTDQPKMLAVM